jgi:hypothetical protein
MKVEEDRSRFWDPILVAIGRGNVRMIDVEIYGRVVLNLVDAGVFGVGKGYFHVGHKTFSCFLQYPSRGDRSVVDTATGSRTAMEVSRGHAWNLIVQSDKQY